MEEQNSFSGWAIVELMGHRREIGYVTTEHYGAASLFRVDSPEFEEREYELKRPQWVRTDQGVDRQAPAGSKVRRAGVPAKSCLVGPGSIYALNPCTEETARQAIEEGIHRPLILLSIPENTKLVTAGEIADEQDPDFDDHCGTCGETPEECECPPV